MIIFDWLGHMVSTTCADELHCFANGLGLKREWFQEPGPGEHNSHYDLTTEKAKKRALKNGALPVSPEIIISRAWWGHLTKSEWKEISIKGQKL